MRVERFSDIQPRSDQFVSATLLPMGARASDALRFDMPPPRPPKAAASEAQEMERY